MELEGEGGFLFDEDGNKISQSFEMEAEITYINLGFFAEEMGVVISDLDSSHSDN